MTIEIRQPGGFKLDVPEGAVYYSSVWGHNVALASRRVGRGFDCISHSNSETQTPAGSYSPDSSFLQLDQGVIAIPR